MTTTNSKTAPQGTADMSVLDFFNVATDRMDSWNNLNSVAIKLSNAKSSGRETKELEEEVKDLFEHLEVFESYWAYPGLALCKEAADLFKEGDFTAFAQAVQRMTRALMSDSYRRGLFRHPST